MPKSTTRELAQLRLDVLARDGWRCVWPGCRFIPARWLTDDGSLEIDLQMAHLEHRGMGGSREANRPENCITLCRSHHDIFDGRDGSSNTKRELALMLRTVAGI